MIRLNFTKRQRILREHFKVIARKQGERPYVELAIVLDKYNLPNDAEVFLHIRPTGLSNTHILSCGLVQNQRPGLRFDLPKSFGERKLLGEILIVEPKSARLLGVSASFPVEDQIGLPEKEESLLPIRRTDELRGEVWKLDTDNFDSGPVLLLHEEIGDEAAFVNHPMTRALIFPEIIRTIALWTLENLNDDALDNRVLRWKNLFLNEGISLPEDLSQDLDSSNEELYEHAERIAAEFCENHRFVETFILQQQELD